MCDLAEMPRESFVRAAVDQDGVAAGVLMPTQAVCDGEVIVPHILDIATSLSRRCA